jgi:hypothetical protein
MPAFMAGMLAILWLTPLLWGSYEQFLEQSRRAASWLVMAPVLTVTILVVWGTLTVQRIRYAGVIIAMDDETFTIIAFRARTFPLTDLVGAELSADGKQFSVHLADGSSHHYGAKLWDRPPEEVAAELVAAAQAKVESRRLGQTTV